MSHVRRVATPDPWNQHNKKEEFQGSGKQTNVNLVKLNDLLCIFRFPTNFELQMVYWFMVYDTHIYFGDNLQLAFISEFINTKK